MTIPPQLISARERAEQAMPDQITITRERTGTGTLDPVTNQITPAVTNVYSGPCTARWQSATEAGVAPTAGGVTRADDGYLIRLPYRATPPERGDAATVTFDDGRSVALIIVESPAGSTHAVTRMARAVDPTRVEVGP